MKIKPRLELDPLAVMLREKEREIDQLHGRILQLTDALHLAEADVPDGLGDETADMFRRLSALRDMVHWWLTGRVAFNTQEIVRACEEAQKAAPVCRQGDHR